ncbi:CbtA family protein [Flavisphingomonas formosensis]|uniref:CbtA family protein n=1 Tax=Flavisphingomonas formosensis TaxID=861534 RepID=UPI0012F953F6|nr:CbtA family protein [Sphingomonas formosensis]
MTKDLLWRGMLAGILAALLATLFARSFAEPLVDRAIAFEESSHEAHAMGAHAEVNEPEIVSRDTQKGEGLLTAMLLYGAAVGGIFSLVFAYGYGRFALIGPRTLALLLAALAFVAVILVPAIKYPPNPPAVGRHETVAVRTAAYFAMIAISLIAMMAASRLRAMMIPRLGAFNALLAGAAAFLLVVSIVPLGLPSIDEVPAAFPADLLWDFRVTAFGTQLVLWAALGIGFGAMAERVLQTRH